MALKLFLALGPGLPYFATACNGGTERKIQYDRSTRATTTSGMKKSL